jgi:endoglucanase
MLRILLPMLLATTVYGQAIITDRIHIDQIGYRPNDRKIAVVSDPQTGYNASDSYVPGATLELRDASTSNVVFTGPAVAWNGGATHSQSGDKCWWFDFSSVTTPGMYVVYDAANNRQSYPFEIATDVYNDALLYAQRVFYYQRCGVSKTAACAGAAYSDSPCHVGTLQDLACRSVSNPVQATERDMSGGWHDAGDYNKYTNFTYVPVHFLLDAYEQAPAAFGDANNIPESGNGTPDILDEVKFELEWLLKMQNADGSAIMKISTLGFNGGSPPSTDANQRYYSAAASSATRTVCSQFAHAAIVFRNLSDPLMQDFGDTLLVHAELAWQWLQANTAYSNYNNETFSSANPEVGTAEQDARKFVAAVYLYAATGNTVYRTYVDANYTSIQPLSWTYWYPFEPVVQDAMLYYTTTAGATAATVTAIQNSCINSTSNNNADMLPAYTNQTDPYMAYMKDQDYVWNNNEFKCEAGIIFANMNRYTLDVPNQTNYRNAAAGFVHYIHGVNPNAYCYLSNSDTCGADRFVDQIYHGWFGDGTIYDGTVLGPPACYLTCGANYYYNPDAAYTGPPIEPPMNQPHQKCYKNWNTSWPENSWEVTEVGIYTEAAYIKLLSMYADTFTVITSMPIIRIPNVCNVIPVPANDFLEVNVPVNNVNYELEIVDLQGKVMLKQSVTNGSKVSVAQLPSGFYLCNFREPAGIVRSQKITITH